MRSNRMSFIGEAGGSMYPACGDIGCVSSATPGAGDSILTGPGVSSGKALSSGRSGKGALGGVSVAPACCRVPPPTCTAARRRRLPRVNDPPGHPLLAASHSAKPYPRCPSRRLRI
eukprot:5171512-Prymnesium_polylepis.1